MLECERLFGAARGLEIQQLVEGAFNETCPCKQGFRCPLLPKIEDAGVRLELV